MRRAAIVVGAGMGGLAAAVRLARSGFDVELLEARAETGGLASGVTAAGIAHDGGPYVLLDRPGLGWAFRELGLDLDAEAPLRRLDEAYEVHEASAPDDEPVRLAASLQLTADRFDTRWPGSGGAYRRFVARMERSRARLEPLLRTTEPGPLDLLRGGAWRDAPLLLRSLRGVLGRSALPPRVQDALAIWTHVAGQDRAEAPSPMAFVPALIHGPGAHVPEGGMRAIPAALRRAAEREGVALRCGARVTRLRRRAASWIVETDAGASEAPLVISGAGGLATCLEWVEGLPARWARRLRSWPLQSPGACAYLRVRDASPGAPMRFRLRAGSPARLLVLAGMPGAAPGAPQAARLISPLPHRVVEGLDEAAQDALVASLLDEPWWREHVGEATVDFVRRPCDWAREFRLHRQAMNPVMTARLLRSGRLPHRAPGLPGLYLCGSATHPGQWVSFCAISGVLAADAAARDAGAC